MRQHPAALLLFATLCPGLSETAAAGVEVFTVSKAPLRPHLLAAGGTTTFVVAARNGGSDAVGVTFRIERPLTAASWRAAIADADTLFLPRGPASDRLDAWIAPGDTARVVARIDAGEALGEGAEMEAVVTVFTASTPHGSVALRSRVRNRPKVHYVAIDGLGRGYLHLARNGRTFDGTAGRLMPRAWTFAAESARLLAASSVLPAVTDPNHSAALTGSWPGTLGLFAVRQHYLGEDAGGRTVMADNHRGMLRWGADGRRIESVFDVNKDPAAGGSPDAFNAVISGKNWLADLWRDQAVDLVVHGMDFPDYLPAPEPYRLGDPPTDDDAEADRDGTNVGPWAIRHFFSTEARLIGVTPFYFPQDRWIAEAAVRVIQAEDPDVLYVDLASTDEAQHVFGAADRPGEWSDNGTPAVLWDDENAYNRNANRDPVLDVVYEADRDFGLIADTLRARGTTGRSYLILLSDHGLTTAMSTSDRLLDPGRVLLDGGFTEAEVERAFHRGEIAHLDLRDPSQAARAEGLLESYQAFDPVAQQWVRPFIVVNREEMDEGRDFEARALLQDGVLGNHRGELYSEWNMEVPATAPDKVRWPDLFIFTRQHFRTKISTTLESNHDGPPMNGVHGAPASAEVLLAVSGPGIQPGIYPQPASLVDIAPTLYHLLGAAPPANVDGRILHEILQ